MQRTVDIRVPRPQVDHLRRSSRRSLDRELEHGARRQQEALFKLGRDHRSHSHDVRHLRSDGPRPGVAGHGFSLRDGLRRSERPRLAAVGSLVDEILHRNFLKSPCLRPEIHLTPSTGQLEVDFRASFDQPDSVARPGFVELHQKVWRRTSPRRREQQNLVRFQLLCLK